jgi:hypothetical protein
MRRQLLFGQKLTVISQIGNGYTNNQPNLKKYESRDNYFAAATDVESSPVKLEPLFLDATFIPLRLFTYLKTPL